ncbi:MAG: hypothetical protein AAF485_07480 [Chloroflexota bacterium]
MSAIAHGGAIYGFDINLTVVNSHFENNHCLEDDCTGGAIYLLNQLFTPVPLLLITNTDFISNSARRFGGAIYSTLTTTVQGGTFERNQAEGLGPFTQGGGAISMFGRPLTIQNSRFLTNTIWRHKGGAIGLNFGALKLTDTYFSGNRSDAGEGGAVAIEGFIVPDIRNSDFVNNIAETRGGALWTQLVTVTLEGGRLEGNEVLTDSGQGGGIYSGHSLVMTGTRFVSNSAPANGGGAYVTRDAILNGGQFERNIAGGSNPFFHGGAGLFVMQTVNLIDTQFISNSTSQIGGGIRAFGPSSFNNGLFKYNQAQSGGGVYIDDFLTLVDTKFISNSATGFNGGGALVTRETVATNSRFEQNRAASSGAGLHTLTMTLVSSHFISNTAESFWGGGVFASKAGTISNTVFQENHSANGGGLYAAGKVLVIENSRFLSNTTTGNGGGASTNNITSHFRDNLFLNNRSLGGFGGGFYASGSLFMTDTRVISNEAIASGGGMYIRSNATFYGNLFDRNISGNQGGGFYVHSTLTLSGTTVTNNQAAIDGGGGYGAFNWATLLGGYFADNVAQGNGGGFVAGRGLVITASRFIHNHAVGLGGGVYNSSLSTSRRSSPIVNSLFVRNEASMGNAVAISTTTGSTTTLLYSTMANPNLTAGSAIYATIGVAAITNSIIANHTVGLQQANLGAIYEDYNLFFNNTADVAGTVMSGGNKSTGDPSFVNPAIDDYHLSGNSSAIDQAIDIGIDVDFEGDSRPQGDFDLGYDEYVSQNNYLPLIIKSSESALNR